MPLSFFECHHTLLHFQLIKTINSAQNYLVLSFIASNYNSNFNYLLYQVMNVSCTITDYALIKFVGAHGWVAVWPSSVLQSRSIALRQHYMQCNYNAPQLWTTFHSHLVQLADAVFLVIEATVYPGSLMVPVVARWSSSQILLHLIRPLTCGWSCSVAQPPGCASCLWRGES